MPKGSRKYKNELKGTIDKIRAKRGSRDAVFQDLSDNSCKEQWDKLRNWINDEIGEIDKQFGGIEPLTKDDITRSLIESLWDELAEIKSSFEKNVLNLPFDANDPEISNDVMVEKIFEAITAKVMPLVNRLMRLRKILDSAYEQVFPKQS